MKTILIIALSAVLFTQSANATKANNWEQYEQLAEKVEANITTASFKELTEKSIELVNLSKQLLPEFMSKESACKNYLSAVLSASDEMLTISLDDIERDYHSDGKLPKVDSPICYYAKDLLVHPTTMAIVANTQNDTKKARAQIKLELEEVLTHFSFVKQAAGYR
ncbi:hypothetical protein [Pseudocolwellia agarivorans]|uniref:hypothetical protein n=1 Tax=Pseudocolwellia agarivorans TaxID=1911682 RepID=UPI000985D234|nr:hypothetical protein [Pseudocolwellia agarivorans]